ncbi:immunity 52 family protein [Corallococcus sp. M34]|uniref:immunity 52 family protein n=1 Tax=Citreicoccus inhibens TaxID=2849499 RepID=UPI001C25001D|nr:immunity 52 family protein [Citreicoccus inhibens]MBU8901011.1 immunity 52 family protein [Citreicoccus inhibens]
MTERYYAGVYWSGRRGVAEEHARRAGAFFRGLVALDPTFAQWFEQSSSRTAALASRFEPTQDALSALFAEGKYRQGAGDVAFAAWNGESEGGTVASITCGSRSRHVLDRCTVTLPSKGGAAERLLSAPVMAEIMRSMVLAWEPEWGVATSVAHRDNVSEEADPGTFAGWVMYFSRQRGEVPPLPSPVQVEPVGDQGTLIVITPERFSATNLEHVALAARVHDLLDRAGLLKSLLPPG